MNKKLTKLLSVFLIAGLIGAGTAVGVTGCKKGGGSGTSSTQTEQNITWNMKGHGTKPTDAADKTSGGKVTKPTDPVDPTDEYKFDGWYEDDACTTPFDFTKKYTSAVTVYAKWTKKNQEATGTKLVKEWAKADYDAAADNNSKKWLEDGSEVMEGVSIAGADLEIESNSKKIIYDGAEKSVGYRVKFGGELFDEKDGVKTVKRSIKVEVEEDATLLVYGTAGTSNKTAYISLAEGTTTGEGADAVTTLTIVDTQQICWLNGDMNAVVFELEAGKTYYFGSDTKTAGDDNASNANIYYMEINTAFDEGLGEKVNTKAADCENQGIKTAHYYTKYGRYLDATTEEVLDPNGVFEAALGHKWTYTTVTAPKAEEAGSVTLTCARDNTHTVPVTLPALKTNGAYERKAADEGKTEYSFKYEGVYEGETKVDVIKFVTDTVDEAQVAFVDISGIVCEEGEGDEIYTANGTPQAVGNGTLKLTAGNNKGSEMGTDKNLNAKFMDGVLSMDDTDTAATLYAVLGFDAPKTSGVYRVSGIFNGVNAGGWDPIQIVTDTAITADGMDSKILFALSSGSSKKYCMRLGANRRTESSYTVDSTPCYFRLDVDLDNHMASIAISFDGEDWDTIDTVTDASITTFAGIRFQTASGSRSFSVEKLAVAQQMEVQEVAAAGAYQMVRSQYNYGVLSYVKMSNYTLNVTNINTFTINMGGAMNGTWAQPDGEDYFECTVPGVGPQGADVTMYAVYDETNKAMFIYESEQDMTAGTNYMVFVKNGEDISSALATKFETDGFGVVEAGESENPLIIAALSATPITNATVAAGTPVYYQYKNTTAEAVKITIIVGENTGLYRVVGSAATSIDEKITVSLGAGETIVLMAGANEGTGIAFTFRAYDSAQDEGVAWSITFDYNGIGEDSNYTVSTKADGKLASLPTPDPVQFYTFEGWFLDDGVWEQPVTLETVFTENTTIYAKWTATGTIIEEQNNSYDYSKIDGTGKADNARLNQSDFDATQNAWLKVVNTGEGNNGDFVAYRTSNARIEVNNGGLKVYFGAKGGSLSITVKSTGGSNDSLIGLKNASGAYIAAKTDGGATAATEGAQVAGASGAKVSLSAAAVGAYIVSGSTEKTLTFEVTDAGWYTIYSDRSETTRGIVVTALSRKVNAYTVTSVAATQIELSKTATTIDEQKNETITATVTLADDVYIKEIEWTSKDTTVATVDKNGKITVLKKGESDTVEIELSVTDSLNRTVKATVTVTVNHVAATGINITTSSDKTWKVGDKETLTYEVTTASGTATDVKKVTWNSSNTAVATVDDNGEVTVVGAGSTDITVKITTLTSETGFTSGAYTITVASLKATEITSVAAVTVKTGRTAQISPVVGPAGASGYTLTYAVTEGDTFASVNASTGVVTGIAAGTATVTVTLNDGESNVDTKTCTVTVADPTPAQFSFAHSDDNSGITGSWSSYGDGSLSKSASSDSPAVNGTKIENGKGLQLTATGFKATLNINGFTSGSSSSVTLIIQAVDAQGNMIKEVTVNSTKSKKNGAFYTGTESSQVTDIVLEMDAGVEFAGIKFVIDSTHCAITSASITVLS